MMTESDAKKVATDMIAAARLLHPFTDTEVIAIPRLLTVFEQLEASRGKSFAHVNGTTPANDAFSSFTTWPKDDAGGPA